MNGNKLNLASVTGTVFVIGIVILVNLLSQSFFHRFDLTENKIYSLSEVSKNLVEDLDSRLVIKAYFSKDLPPKHNRKRRFLKDKLDAYRAYGGANVEYNFINPSKKKKHQREARKFGIRPVRVRDLKNDEMTVKRAYMGAVFMYKDKKEVLPLIKDLKGLEYDISSIIRKLAAKNLPKIGYVTGQGEPSLYRGKIRKLKSKLDGQYELSPVDLSRDTEISSEVKTLLILSPKDTFSTTAKYKIDQFLMRGGRLAFFLDKVDANIKKQSAEVVDLNIDGLTTQYGFKVNNNLVMDRNCGKVNVAQQRGPFTMRSPVDYPFIPRLGEDNFNDENLIVNELEDLGFIFTSSIDTSYAKGKKNIEVTPLVYTSDSAGIQTPQRQQRRRRMRRRQSSQFNIRPKMDGGLDSYSFDTSKVLMAAAFEGKFNSRYDAPPQKGMSVGSEENKSHLNESPETKIVAVGDGDFVNDEYMSSKTNLTFVLNVIDWLTVDKGLITIRSKGVTSRPLDEISSSTKKTLIKYSNVIIPPLFLIIFGLIRWRIRKKRKRTQQKSY